MKNLSSVNPDILIKEVTIGCQANGFCPFFLSHPVYRLPVCPYVTLMICDRWVISKVIIEIDIRSSLL